MAESAKRMAWMAVAILWVAAVFDYLDRNIVSTLHDPIVASVPMTEAGFGLLTSVLLWVYGLASPVCGYVADRFSRRKVLFASVLIWSLATLGMAWMHSFAGLLWMRAMIGASQAVFIPAGYALVCDHHRGSTRSLANGLFGSGFYLGGVLAGLGGYIAAIGGWRFGLMALGAAGSGYSLFLILTLRDAPLPGAVAASPRVSLAEAGREVLRRPAFWLLQLLFSLNSIANWLLYAWLPIYLQGKFHLGIGRAGISATGYLQVASFAFSLIGGILADRWSVRNPRARMLVPAIGFCLAGPGLWAVGASGALWAALAGVVAYGIGRGCYDANNMPMLRQVIDERYSATGYGVLNCIGNMVGGGMTLLGGFVRDAGFGLDILFKACGVAILLTSALLFFLRPGRAG